MSPRELRTAIKCGELVVANPKLYAGNIPEPPPEWNEMRRRRMAIAASAAVQFLKGHSWTEISAWMESRGLLEQKRGRKQKGPVVTKARVQQYVSKGIQFLESRGCFKPLTSGKAKKPVS